MMSSGIIDKLQNSEWVEELQRKVFEECVNLAMSQDKILEELSEETLENIPISVIINNIRQSFSQLPNFRNRTDFLNELSKSLQMVAHDKRDVNWFEFKESSEHWFLNLLNLVEEDSNNNIHSNHSASSPENLEKDVLRGEDIIESTEDYMHPLNQADTMASCYSLNSSSLGLGTMDSTLESSEETDQINEDLTSIDLQVRFRRFNEENSHLRNELSRAEDSIITLESNLKSTQKSLDKMIDKCSRLRKDADEYKDMLLEGERREDSYKQELKKLEKSYIALQKKVEKLESEKENILNLKAQVEELTRENSDLTKQLSENKAKYDEKIIECEYLQEENDELHNINIRREKSFEKNIQHHQEKIQELQNINAELQSQNLMNKSDSSSQFSLTPPPHNQANIHSTPYKSKRKSRHQDSLFSELKASGFNFDESKVQELLHEISFYNSEITLISEQVDEALKEIAAWKNEICSPSIQLVEADIVQSLKNKITTLLNSVRNWMVEHSSPAPIMKGDQLDQLGKPDVLPVTKKFGNSMNIQSLGQKNQDSDLVGSITSSKRLISIPGVCFDKSTSPIPEATINADINKILEEPEEIVPIVEALNRIIELREVDDAQTDERTRRPRVPKKKAIFTSNRNENWKNIVPEGSKLKYSISNSLASGDGPHLDHLKANTQSNSNKTINMKTLKSEVKDYNPSPDDSVTNINSKFITMREKTYLVGQTVDSTTNEKYDNESFKFNDTTNESSYFPTPVKNQKSIPRRKLSVYNRSFDIDSLQTPSTTTQTTISDKKRSASTPDVQEVDFKNLQSNVMLPLKIPVLKDNLLTTYRCPNSSESSNSPSPKKEISLMVPYEDSPAEMPLPIKKTLILAPTKFKLPDSTVNSNLVNSAISSDNDAASSKDLSFALNPANIAAHQSKIISGSSNLINEEIKPPDSKISGSYSNSSVYKIAPSSANQTFSKSSATSNTFSISSSKQNFGTFTVEDSKKAKHCEKSTTTTTTTNTTNLLDYTSTTDASNGSIPQSGATCSGSEKLGELQPSVVVERAMSSGEESSAESEAGGGKAPPISNDKNPQNTTTNLDIKSTIIGRQRSNSCTEIIKESKVEPSSNNVNGDIKKNSDNVIETAQHVLKENESPKAFPSWTDEKLQESGIASFPDMDSELSENLSEEELKKKYAGFSVGLSTDRMTLSKRIILARRHRDQSEKNFNNEVHKMQQDIKDLAPLCVDSESVERVERVRQQLDMVSRCSHRISCTAETLGAVHQERRVSRAVLLADKYLQTLRAKCEKLASELSETKKILAENNIVLEDNLSEMGDDVPRVRYRAVPNNNRTMMARRRASIATISRPLIGSNQDISKEVPRQRNSVSGRVPGVRRPSLCYETPKWEIEKLDQADSTGSITELREIFEQAESRRNSREENNNTIRTSVNNLSTLNDLAVIPSENTEEEYSWTNVREEVVPEPIIENELRPFELSHRYTCHYINWFTDNYTTWKTVLLLVFIVFTVFFMNHIVYSSERGGPPATWWSLEEILNQYIQVEAERYNFPRPV